MRPRRRHGEAGTPRRPALKGIAPASKEDIAALWDEALAATRALPGCAMCTGPGALGLARKTTGEISGAELVWGTPFQPVESFCTIGLSTPEELAEKVEELQGFPWIKIKSDHAADLKPIRFIRERTQARLAVDANCAWGGHDLARLCADLRDLGVEFVEQPFSPGETAALSNGRLALPVLADESCVTEADVERAAEHFSGFNIKLVKCGGLTPALRMLRRGRELGQAGDGRLHARKQCTDRRGCSDRPADRLRRSRWRLASL